jgi:hypothetical protein
VAPSPRRLCRRRSAATPTPAPRPASNYVGSSTEREKRKVTVETSMVRALGDASIRRRRRPPAVSELPRALPSSLDSAATHTSWFAAQRQPLRSRMAEFGLRRRSSEAPPSLPWWRSGGACDDGSDGA